MSVASSYSVSDRYATLTRQFSETLAEWAPSWTRFAKLYTDQTPSLRFYADQPPAILNTWGGADTDTIATPSVGATHTQTVTLEGKAGGVHIRAVDLALQPNLIEECVSRLYTSVTKTVESVVYSALENVFSSAVDDGNGSTTPICSAGHKFKPIGYTSGALSSQSNLLTSAFSGASLSSALQLMQNYKSFLGIPAGYGMGECVLIVSPQNGDLADQMAKSSQSITTFPDAANIQTATGAAMNPRQGMLDVVKSSLLTADPDDWYLIDKANTPVFVWMPFAPSLVVYEDYANHTIKATVSCFMKAGVQTPPGAIVGSNVA